MKECSAYCQPDKNIHTYAIVGTKWMANDIGLTGRVSWDPRYNRSICLPDGVRLRVLAVEPAPECDLETTDEFPFKYLETVEVLEWPR